jgi:hypothetical protein
MKRNIPIKNSIRKKLESILTIKDLITIKIDPFKIRDLNVKKASLLGLSDEVSLFEIKSNVNNLELYFYVYVDKKRRFFIRKENMGEKYSEEKIFLKEFIEITKDNDLLNKWKIRKLFLDSRKLMFYKIDFIDAYILNKFSDIINKQIYQFEDNKNYKLKIDRVDNYNNLLKMNNVKLSYETILRVNSKFNFKFCYNVSLVDENLEIINKKPLKLELYYMDKSQETFLNNFEESDKYSSGDLFGFYNQLQIVLKYNRKRISFELNQMGDDILKGKKVSDIDNFVELFEEINPNIVNFEDKNLKNQNHIINLINLKMLHIKNIRIPSFDHENKDLSDVDSFINEYKELLDRGRLIYLEVKKMVDSYEDLKKNKELLSIMNQNLSKIKQMLEERINYLNTVYEYKLILEKNKNKQDIEELRLCFS